MINKRHATNPHYRHTSNQAWGMFSFLVGTAMGVVITLGFISLTGGVL